MSKNFFISDNLVEVLVGNTSFDLHNDYLLHDISKNYLDVTISFKKIIGKWIATELPNEIYFEFSEVKYFELTADVWTGGCYIDTIGYKNEGDTNYDWLLTEKGFQSNSHLVFWLEDENW